MQIREFLIAIGITGALAFAAPADEETTRALTAIRSVTREGKGNEDAAPAWKTLVSKGPAVLMPILDAFDDSNPTAVNWLRTAVDAIAEGERVAGHKFPEQQLEAFATNPKNAASGRLVAYELLAAQNPTAKARLLPGFLNDKSPDLRRTAIEFELDKLEQQGGAGRKAGLERLFACSRDKDQVELLAKKLAEQGVKSSITEHFAFVTQFALIGPFDSTGGKGFQTAFPPESARDTSGKYPAKTGDSVTWKPAETFDQYGTFDLNKLLDKHKDSVAYALAVIVAEKETPCDIRVASPNAVQIFLNGKKLFEREEYHHGGPFDANIGKGVLKKGENVIVLKVCQNNQTETWAQSWEFKLRVCDATGGPIPGLVQRLPESARQIKLGFIPETAETKKEKE